MFRNYVPIFCSSLVSLFFSASVLSSTDQSAIIAADDQLPFPPALLITNIQAQQSYLQNHLPPSPASPLCATDANSCATQQANWVTFLQQYDSANNPPVAILSSANVGGAAASGSTGGAASAGGTAGQSGGTGTGTDTYNLGF